MPVAEIQQPKRRGVRVGKYEILRHIAAGGMGAVYRALDTRLRREVALKVLSPELATRPELLGRFRREAVCAARLRHENIVALFEYGEATGTHYLALELVDGVDLGEYLRVKGKLDPSEVWPLLVQAARALDHAHSHGIVHRDIKPGNFLLTFRNGQPLLKLTDLGLARHVEEARSRLTRIGTTVGTVDYLSPEQARDSGRADIRSDLYSLGCTMYHLLAGQPPFASGTLADRLRMHLTAEPPDVRSFNPAVGPQLVEILSRLLAKKPEDRFQTPRDLLNALEHGAPPVSSARPVAMPMPVRMPARTPLPITQTLSNTDTLPIDPVWHEASELTPPPIESYDGPLELLPLAEAQAGWLPGWWPLPVAAASLTVLAGVMWILLSHALGLGN